MSDFLVSSLSRAMSFTSTVRRTQEEIDDTRYEVVTGLQRKPLKHLGGDMRPLYAVEGKLKTLSLHQDTLTLGLARGEASLRAIEQFAALGAELTASVTVASGYDLSVVRTALIGVEGHFEDMVNALNATFAGQSLFSGAATDRNAITSASEILDDLLSITGSTVDGATFEAEINAYFKPGGHYETLRYSGSEVDAPAVILQRGSQTSVSIKATSPEIVETLKAVAKLNLFASGKLALSESDQIELSRKAALDLGNALSEVRTTTATLGYSLSRIEAVSAEVSTSFATLQIQRGRLIGADQYEAATRYENLKARLDASYQLTARISEMSLFNYIG